MPAANPRMRTILPLVLLSVGLVPLVSLLSGCGRAGGSGSFGSATAGGQIHLTGTVHGGQQPVAGATIQLYTVGTTGLKSASTPLIGTTILTDSGGSFSITGTYTCTGATQVYITATGGNPGGGTNSALALGAALGACSNLTPATNISINELTTVAAAYALAPFASDFQHIGATGSNPSGLVGAFSNAAMLVSSVSGSAPGAGLAAGVTVPVAELNTLGNILASCVNTTGPSSSSCQALFTATGATETFGAAFAIANNPGSPAVTGLYTLPSPGAPFQPSLALTSAPNDFTVAITSTAGDTLSTPYGLAIDAGGNAWVTNSSGTTVNEIGASGTGLAALTAPGLTGAQAVALDRSGNVLVANTAGNSVIKIPVLAGIPAAPLTLTGGGVAGPTSLAVDSAGNVFVSNFNGASVTGYSVSGAPLAGSPFTGNSGIVRPVSLAVDASGNVLVTSDAGSVVKLSNAGAYASTLNDSTLQGPLAVAIDPGSGSVFATGFTTGTAVSGALTQFNSAGAAVSANPVTAGLSVPGALAVAGSTLWIVNNTASGGLAQYAIGASTPLSPAAGFGALNAPAGVAVDATGSVWTTNSGSNTVSKFIGLSTPVTTPMAVTVGP